MTKDALIDNFIKVMRVGGFDHKVIAAAVKIITNGRLTPTPKELQKDYP